MRPERLLAASHIGVPYGGSREAGNQWPRVPRQRGRRLPPVAAAAAAPLLPAMRQRAGSLLKQAAVGVVAGSHQAATYVAGATGAAGARRLLAPVAAALHEGNGSGNGSSNGSGSSSAGSAASYGSYAGAGAAKPSQQQTPAAAPGSSASSSASSSPGLSASELDAAVQAAAPSSWLPAQRAELRDAVGRKLAAMQAHLERQGQKLWSLRAQPEQLVELGISSEELQSLVLVRYGTGPEALQQLAALVASKQAAVMGAGEEQEWTHLAEQRQAGGGPTAGAQQPQAGALPPQQQGFVPAWRAQQQAQQAASVQQWQQQQAPQGQGQPLEPTQPSSSQVTAGGGWQPPAAATYAERRAQWQAQQGQGQGPPPSQQQPKHQAAPVRASIRDLLNGRKIRLPQYAPGTYNHLMCPECLGGDKGEKSLSVTIAEGSEGAVWNCFRAKCGWTGGVNTQQGTSKAYRQYMNDSGFAVTAMRKRKDESPLRPNPSFDAALSPEVLDFFAARCITPATLERNRVAQETLADGSTAIAFPYYRDSQLVNIKYRAAAEKKFWQVKGAEKVLYGLDDVVGISDIVVVEGEMDKLALEEAGIRNVVSVPDGAPARVREGEVPPADQDTKFSYLWNCRAWLDGASKVVIATDNDAPGDALAEELARRLGRERCWRVRWPLNEEDHQYAAELAGVQYVRARDDGTADASDAAAAKGVAAEGLGGEGGDASSSSSSNGSNGSSSDAAAATAQGQEQSAEALQLAVQPGYYRKDANEVLIKDGPSMLRAFLDNAEPFPIRGLLRFHEYYDDIMKYYRLEHKDGQGRSTGWPSLDALYKVVPGELTIVTGVPNSGKSEWIDGLLANLAEQHDWCFALCSMEKKATDHARQLVEKYIGKPFFDLPYARGVRRMSERELDEGLDWIDDRFHLVRYEDDALPAVDWVLDVARAAVYRYGIRGLVIDPYNELDHQRPASMNETEYVSQMLTKVKRFAQTTGVHVWFVAHPRQLREWKGQAPNLYDISGSAHFINKADNGIVVHRDRDPDSPDQNKVHILVRKVRNKAAGTIGDCVLEYERINGRYVDPESPAGGPRTAQRVDFADLLRQERLAALRQEEREAAMSAALQAELVDAELAGGIASRAAGAAGSPRMPTLAPPAAAAAAATGVRPQAAAAAGMGQQPQQQAAQRGPTPAAAAPAPRLPTTPPSPAPAPEPQLAMRFDGTVSNDPVTDEQEVAAWLEGTGGAS